MNLPTFATLLIAATAHTAHAQTCDPTSFGTATYNQVTDICTVVPNLPNQPGAPKGTVDGIFCTDTGTSGVDAIGEYTLEFDALGPLAVTSGTGNILRATLFIPSLFQNPAPGETRRLSEEEISDRRLERKLFNPLLDPAVNGGDDAPTKGIKFQGFFTNDCNFNLVSTQGGQLTGTLNPVQQSVQLQFTQSGQVTSPLDTLPGQFQDDNVVGLFVSNFAFAFQGVFQVL